MWKKLLSDFDIDNTTAISKLYKLAISKNIQYLRHYQKLVSDFESADVCHYHYLNDFNNKIKQSVTSKTEVERNSILNDYVKINPLLISPIEIYRLY